ncbi:hypothetical protein E3P92_03727 [Wallemia ichthyophaga]|uniref:Protein OS-9 homolog n=1 Tax=Wallemia ichthyophaga TaxID=245174 RepID=A0A4T0GYX8_WALIC|nr:hypothetical protein E3P91_04039 [Wallemia ichthyophaga]TIA78081.1 hypothetical protein E3P98_03987 [Wallemia ichthyophaga]TIB07906.1 hypothetical protein E3P93_03693 [Wallemia ichthyophaga]TIB08344.1 hypothetical protein E3P90_03708 [Wallemia ichthyophaga]TIB08565.1 hypothetical protein E3P92_03727 [Wallemia ichthyophaga]
MWPAILITFVISISLNLTASTSPYSFISHLPSYSVQFARRTFVTPDEANQILKAGEINLDTYALDVSQPLKIADVALREPVIPLNPFEHSTPHRFQLYPDYSFICVVPSDKESEPAATPESHTVSVQDVCRILDTIREECTLFTSGKWYVVVVLRLLYLIIPLRWTYRVCFNGAIKQFHANRTPLFSDDRKELSWKVEFDDKVPSYILGRSPVQASTNADVTKDITKVDKTPANPTLKILGNGFQKYAVEEWGNGTFCDKTGEPRSTAVEYYCAPGVLNPRIISIHEVTTCNYVVQVESGQLCELISFNHMNLKGKVKEIECIPILEHGSIWPDLLVEDEEFIVGDQVEVPDHSKSLDTRSKEDLIELIAHSQII